MPVCDWCGKPLAENGPTGRLGTAVGTDASRLPRSVSLGARSYRANIAGLRVAAAFAVVTLHVADYAMTQGDGGTLNWWIAGCLNACTRWAVPVFIMISGALLLDPRRQVPAGEFYRKRIHKILIPLVFWSLFYLRWKTPSGEMTWLFVVKQVILGRPAPHLWYLYMILGLYYFTPFLQAFTAHVNPKEQLCLILSLFAAVAAQKCIDAFTATTTPTVFSMFVGAIPYYLCGHLLSQIVPPRRWIKYIAAGIIVSWLGMVVGTGLLFQRIGFYLYSPYCPPVITISIGIFLLATTQFRLPGESHPRRYTVLRHLDKVSFGVYLVHPVCLQILMGPRLYGESILGQPLIFIPVVALMGMLCSVLITSLLAAVPILRRIV